MKNIVIWGAGKYGRYLSHEIKRLESNQYNVVGFADSRYRELNYLLSDVEKTELYNDVGIREIYGFEKTKELFEKKIIDGVVIAIKDINEYRKVEDTLMVMGVNTILLHNNGYEYAERIAVDYYRFDSVKIYILEEIEIASEPDVNGGYQYATLIDKESKILIESERYFAFSFLERPLIESKYGLESNVEYLDEGCSLLYAATSINYGHFIMACASKIYLMIINGYKGDFILFDSSFAREIIGDICDLLGVSIDRFVWVGSNTNNNRLLVKKLHCFENVLDSSKTAAEMVVRLAECMLNSSKCRIKGRIEFPKRLYVKRSGNRKLIGCDEIIEEYGFKIIEPEKYSFLTQMEYFANADIVISPHGAATTNAIFMKRDSMLIETFGSGFVDLFYAEVVHRKGIKYRMLVAQKDYQQRDFNDDYTIHPVILRQTIEEAISTIER